MNSEPWLAGLQLLAARHSATSTSARARSAAACPASGSVSGAALAGLIAGTIAVSSVIADRVDDEDEDATDAAFDALMRWLYQLESDEGALVTELSLSESGTPGRVNATVRVAGGG